MGGYSPRKWRGCSPEPPRLLRVTRGVGATSPQAPVYLGECSTVHVHSIYKFINFIDAEYIMNIKIAYSCQLFICKNIFEWPCEFHIWSAHNVPFHAFVCEALNHYGYPVWTHDDQGHVLYGEVCWINNHEFNDNNNRLEHWGSAWVLWLLS